MSDIRREKLGEIYKALFKFAGKHASELKLLNCETEDFVQEVIYNIFNRKGLDKWDDKKTYAGFEAVIYNIAGRKLIDMKRAKFGAKTRQYYGSPVLLVSTSSPIPNIDDKNLTLGDMLEADEDMAEAFFELMDEIPDVQISPNYNLTWRTLLKRSVYEEPEEIASSLCISCSRVQQLQRELLVMCKGAM